MNILATFTLPHPPLIVSEIGKGREEDIKLTKESYEQVSNEICNLKPDTIIIISPHAPIYSDGFYIANNNHLEGSFEKFGASSVKFNEEIDVQLVDEIIKNAEENNLLISCGSKELDHGAMVPLYFIRKKYKCKIVLLGFSYLPLITNYKMGMILKKSIEKLNRKVVIVASGDLSHKLKKYGPYGYIEEGPLYDKKIIEVLSTKRFNELMEFDEDFLDKAAECGHRSFTIMAGALDGYDVNARFYSHEDITGVGYGITSFYPSNKDENRCFYNKYLEIEKEKVKSNDEYVSLARITINNYIENNIIIDIPSNTSESLLNNKNGVFVSIHKFGRLRGCIGTIIPTTNCIAKEIINNAISAATRDTRFNKIEKDELDYLEINVDILSKPEKIESIDELDPKIYGVIVSSGPKRGLLLPDLDSIDTINEQLEIAMKKGNIRADEPITLERFTVERHK